MFEVGRKACRCPRRYNIPNTQILQRKIAVFYQKHFKVHFEKQPASAFRISSVVVGQRTHRPRKGLESGAFDFTPPRLSQDWFGFVSGLARDWLGSLSQKFRLELERNWFEIVSGFSRERLGEVGDGFRATFRGPQSSEETRLNGFALRIRAARSSSSPQKLFAEILGIGDEDFPRGNYFTSIIRVLLFHSTLY